MIKVSLLLVVFFVSFSLIADFDCKSVTDWLQAGGSVGGVIIGIVTIWFLWQNKNQLELQIKMEKDKYTAELMPNFMFDQSAGYAIYVETVDKNTGVPIDRSVVEKKRKTLEENKKANTFEFNLINVGGDAFDIEIKNSSTSDLMQSLEFLRNVRNGDKIGFMVFEQSGKLNTFTFKLTFTDKLNNKFEQFFLKGETLMVNPQGAPKKINP